MADDMNKPAAVESFKGAASAPTAEEPKLILGVQKPIPSTVHYTPEEKRAFEAFMNGHY